MIDLWQICFQKYSNIILFYILKVFHCAVFELVAGGIVADDDALGVHLQHADGPHLADTTFYGVRQGTGFAVAVGQDHHLSAVHDGTHTYGEGGLRHFIDVVVEET